MSAANEFRAAAAERMLVKDGAYGTLIQGEGAEGSRLSRRPGAQP